MNKIQTVKTELTKSRKSKKGFTLVELVVVIAILAILAAIAIPIVSNTIDSSTRSSAATDAQTVELALKEAHAQIVAGDKSVYKDGPTTKVADVFAKKALKNIEDTKNAGGKTYTLKWSKTDSQCKYVDTASNKDISDKNITGGNFNTPSSGKLSESTATVLSLFTP